MVPARVARLSPDVLEAVLHHPPPAELGPAPRPVAREANNYAWNLLNAQRFEEAKALLRKPLPVAQRVLGESHELTLKMRWGYAQSLYRNPGATLDDLREAVTTLEDVEQIGRRVLGGSHPLTEKMEFDLRHARAALRVRETPPPGPRVERTFAPGWLDGPS